MSDEVNVLEGIIEKLRGKGVWKRSKVGLPAPEPMEWFVPDEDCEKAAVLIEHLQGIVLGHRITDDIKDGRLLLLEVEGGEHPVEDADRYVTIGFNTLKDTGEDKWHIAGWCWSNDHFTETDGKPVRYWLLPKSLTNVICMPVHSEKGKAQ